MEEIQIFSFGDFDVPNMLYVNRFFLISLSISKRMRTRERRECAAFLDVFQKLVPEVRILS